MEPILIMVTTAITVASIRMLTGDQGLASTAPGTVDIAGGMDTAADTTADIAVDSTEAVATRAAATEAATTKNSFQNLDLTILRNRPRDPGPVAFLQA